MILFFGLTRIGVPSSSYPLRISNPPISGRCFSMSSVPSRETKPCSTSCIAATYTQVQLRTDECQSTYSRDELGH